MRAERAILSLAFSAALLGGCANAASSTPQAPASASSSQLASTSSPGVAASATSPGAFVPPTVATFQPSSGTSTGEWDLVALGDSNVAGWGVRDDEPFSPAEAFPGVYASSLADEAGVTVTLHSYYPSQLGNEVRTIAEWTDVLARDPAMRADLAEAEIVVTLIGFHDMLPVFLYGACPPPWPDPMKACLNGYTASMPADFAELDGAIAGIVPDSTTVLVLDYGSNPYAYDTWGDDPAWPEIRQAMSGDWQDGLRAAATAAGFVVVHMSAALLFDDGRARYDVNEITSDGLHFNAQGHRILADQCLLEDGLSG
jgi:lysophospholipase L1-like esterase